MSITSAAVRKAGPYPCDGIVVAFPFNFKVFSSADVLVVLTDLNGVESNLTTGYAVAVNANQDSNPGGTVTMVAPPTAGYLITLGSQVANTQPMVLTNNGGFFATVLNDMADRCVMLVQQLSELSSRALSLPFSVSPSVSAKLPAPTPNTVFGWDALGKNIVALAMQTGTSLVTLAAAGGAALVGYLQAGTGAVLRTVQDKLRERISVKDFGAVGDGVTDDTAAIQKTIDSINNGQGFTLYFPSTTAGVYLISDQLNVGKFNVAANNNVLGWTSKQNFVIDLNGNTLRWNGADQAGANKVTVADTVGTYPLITDCKAMISVVASQGFKIKNGFLNGLALNGTSRAYSGLWFQGTQARTSFSNLRISGPRMAVRHGCRWDLATSTVYYGYGASPYAIANNVFGVNPAVTGGWAGDTQSHTACSYNGALAHYSTESDQNLSIVFNALTTGEGGSPSTYGILMVGGRITGNGVSCNVAATYDVFMPTGNNSISVTDWHSESANGGTIQAGTVAGTCNIAFNNADKVKLVIPAGASSVQFTAIDSRVDIARYDGTGSLRATLLDSTVNSIGITNTGAKDLVRFDLKNCALVNPVLVSGGPSAQNCYLNAEGCFPLSNLPASTGTYTALSAAFNGVAFDTVSESFEGSTHKIRRREITLPHAVATLVGTIATDGIGASSTGDCRLKLHFATAAGANMAAVFGDYAFSWVRNNANALTVSAVSVINETKTLSGFTSFAPSVTVAIVGTTLQISVSQSNSNTLSAYLELQAEVYVGGAYGVAQLPLWS